jgi:hypothetical protein
MAAAVNIHNIKYFAPIAVSRLYEQRRVFQQMTIYTPLFSINRKAQSAKNMMRNSSLLNNAAYTQTATAATGSSFKSQQQSQKELE